MQLKLKIIMYRLSSLNISKIEFFNLRLVYYLKWSKKSYFQKPEGKTEKPGSNFENLFFLFLSLLSLLFLTFVFTITVTFNPYPRSVTFFFILFFFLLFFNIIFSFFNFRAKF